MKSNKRMEFARVARPTRKRRGRLLAAHSRRLAGKTEKQEQA